MSKIHIKNVLQVMEEQGSDVPFSFTYAKKSGELAFYQRAYVTSIHAKGATVNILIDGDNKPKTFRKICLTAFNGVKIYI